MTTPKKNCTIMGYQMAYVEQEGADGPIIAGDINLGTAWDRVGHDVAVQGNLDPISLFAGRDELRRRASDVMRSAGWLLPDP